MLPNRPRVLTVLLLALVLFGGGCGPRTGLPGPAREVAAAWHDFQRDLLGVGDRRVWRLDADAIRALPVLNNPTWGKMVGAMGGAGWEASRGVMRCAEASLEGSVMTLTLRYGLVLRESTDDEHAACWSSACEFRLRIDLDEVVVATLPSRPVAGSGWLSFDTAGPGIKLEERLLRSWHESRCRVADDLLQRGLWGDLVVQQPERSLRPCFIPGDLSTPFSVLVERIQRSGDAG